MHALLNYGIGHFKIIVKTRLLLIKPMRGYYDLFFTDRHRDKTIGAFIADFLKFTLFTIPVIESFVTPQIKYLFSHHALSVLMESSIKS